MAARTTARPSSRQKPKPEDLLPSAHDWRTTDEQEILKRQVRAREESMRLRNESPEHPVFSNFEVRSESGLRYRVGIRDVTGRQFSCTCADCRKNGLGTCKHVEAVLIHARQKVGRRGWRNGPPPPNGNGCDANTNRTAGAAPGQPTRHWSRSFRTSARACSTSSSPNAPCWPTKWVWARPSRPSPPARSCIALARPAACWWSLQPH